MTTISDSRSLEYLETDLSSAQPRVCHRRHTEHSSSSEIACLNLAINFSFFSSGMLSTATAGSSVTIPFGSKVAGFRISSTKLWGTRLADKHNWRTKISHFLNLQYMIRRLTSSKHGKDVERVLSISLAYPEDDLLLRISTISGTSPC